MATASKPSLSHGTVFAVGSDGIPLLTAWVDPRDGLLVLDRNNDGLITSGNELFGTSTTLADGNLARMGLPLWPPSMKTR